MSQPPQIIDYARLAIPGEIQVRREGDWLTVIIPSPPLSRLILIAAIRPGFYALLLVAAVFICFIESPGARSSDFVKPVFTCLAIPFMAAVMLYQVINVASAGGRPTIIQANAASLQLLSRGYMNRGRTWRSAELMDITACEGPFLPILARQIKFHVILQAERIERFTIPWNGIGALASIEDNLRDVLSLPRAVLPPLPPPHA